MYFKDNGLKLKGFEEDKGIIEAYIVSFDNIDSDGDVIRKGAYSKSIRERGPKGANQIKHFKNHDLRQTPGTVKDLYEDSKGVVMVAQLAIKTEGVYETSIGRDTYAEYKNGQITEHSHGLDIILSEKTKDGFNEIIEAKLWEGSSLTAWGANSNTPVISMKGDSLLQYIHEIETRLKAGTLSDTVLNKLADLRDSMQIHLKEPGDHSFEPDQDGSKLLNILTRRFNQN